MFDAIDYYEWLLEKIDCKNYRVRDYSKLLDTLYSVNYVWKVPFDENRAVDGKYQRLYFAADKNSKISDEFYDQECSVLEMLVAFSEKADRYLYIEEHTYKMFWLMIRNLGLDVFDDAHYSEEYVLYILEDWMEDLNRTPFPSASNNYEGIWMDLNHYVNDKENEGSEVYDNYQEEDYI